MSLAVSIDQGRVPTRRGSWLTAGFVALLYAALVHLAMTPGVPWQGVAGVSVGLATAVYYVYSSGTGTLDKTLWEPLAALAFAFWAFNLMRRLGWVGWPVGRVDDLPQYANLLYTQFIALLTIAAGIVWALRSVPRETHFVHFGFGTVGRAQFAALSLAATLLWLAVVLELWTWPVYTAGSVPLFGSLALLKAIMLAATEEIAFRGVVLPVLGRRLGWPLALLLQAAMYGLFHAYLFPVGPSQMAFVAAVAVLGLILGAIALLTRGILWPVVIHAAFALVVEWLNISQVNSASIF